MAHVTRTVTLRAANGSSTIAQTLVAETTAQQVTEHNIARGSVLFINRSSAAMDLGVDATVTAGNGIPLAANGGTFRWDGPGVPANAFYVVAPSGGVLVVVEG